MIVTGGNGADNHKLLHRLVEKYYPGRMRVVILYRRYFEWFLSMWNEGAKPFIFSNLSLDMEARIRNNSKSGREKVV
jgi:hypothetical protein